MSRVEKAGEPSMEDILASIRKIISEEPAGQPVPEAASGAIPSGARTESGSLAAPALQAPAPVIPTKREPSSPPAVDDVLDDLVAESAPAGGAARSRLEPGVPSWLFPKTAAAGGAPDSSKPASPVDSASAPAGASARRGSDLGAFVPGRLEASLPKERDTSPEQRRQPIPGLTPGMAPQAGRPADQAIPHISFGPPSVSPADLGKARTAADLDAERVAAGIPARDEGDAKPTIKVSAPTRTTPGAEGSGALPTLQAAAENGLLKRAEPAGRPGNPLSPTPAASASTNGILAVGGARPPGASFPTSSAGGATGAKPPLDSLRATPSGVGGADAQVPSVSAAPSAVAGAGAGSPPASAPTSVAGPLSPGAGQPAPAKEATIKATVSGQAVTAAPKPVAIATGGDGSRTLEDTVVELLRPMLRQWLDANLPRIVEKAVRAELAESGKKKH
jgi:cell pole-organizing protein PopZ